MSIDAPLAEAVESIAEERCQRGCTNREPAEDVGSSLLCHAEVTLKHIGGKALEGEDCRVIQHAKQCYNPEELAG